MQPNSNFKWIIIIGVLILGLTASVGWNILGLKTTGLGNTPQALTLSNTDQSLFDFQNASFTGKITKVEGNKIFLENQRGVKGQALVSKNAFISDMSQGGIATPSSDLKKIKLNENAMIGFQVIDGKYEATNITYTQPIPSFAPGQAPPLPPPPVTTPALEGAKPPSPPPVPKTSPPAGVPSTPPSPAP